MTKIKLATYPIELNVESLMQLILLDISNLRTHWAKLKEEAPELFFNPGSLTMMRDQWDYFTTEEILGYMQDDIKELLEAE